MVVGAVIWILFQYICPIKTDVLGAIDPVLLGLPASFIAFVIGNRFGTDLNAARELKLGRR